MTIFTSKTQRETETFENELMKIELSNGRIVWASDIVANASGDVVRVSGDMETPPECYSENVELDEYEYKCLDDYDRDEVLSETEKQEVDKAVRKWCEDAMWECFGK